MTRHERWYRRLLRLFPADFRGDFGSSMAADFDDERQAASAAGRGGLAGLWLRTVGGFLCTGPREHLVQCIADARLGLRLAIRQPGTTTATALVLALGIAGLTSSFAVIDAFMFRPMPYADPDALVHVWSTYRPTGATQNRSAWPDIRAWREASSVQDVAAFNYTEEDLELGGRPERLNAGRLSANAFDVLGAAPLFGRTFRPGEDEPGAGPVAVLSHGFWQRRFGGTDDVLSRSIRVGGIDYAVVGVMPPTFVFPMPLTEAWLPYRFDPDRYGWDWQQLQAVARLAPGAAKAAALEELNAITDAVAREHGGVPGDRGVSFESLRGALNFADDGFRIGGPIMLAASALILFVACANVSSVLLGRALARAREVSVRSAIGASRVRLFRQFMFESVGLGVAAVALGLLLSQIWLARVQALMPLELYRVGEIGLDWRAAAVAIAAATGAVAVAAFLPALRFGRANPAAVLRSEGGGATSSRQSLRTQHVLLATQVTLSVALVACAFVALDVVRGLALRDAGFDRANVLSMKFILGDDRAATAADIAVVHDRLLSETRAVPGVTAAAIVNHLPLNHETNNMAWRRPGDPPAAPDGGLPTAFELGVTSGYFETMGIALEAGRVFDARDTPDGQRTAVINRAFADRLWPGESTVGRTVALGLDGVPYAIVGVVANARHEALLGPDEPIVYRSMAQAPRRHARLVARAAGPDAAPLAEAVQEAVWRVDASLPITELRTLERVVADFLLPQRAMGISMAALGAVGLLLMAIGLYGLLALVVGQRRKEIGVRMALGATTGEVVRSVMSASLKVTVAGLVLGIGLAAMLTTLLSSLLPGAGVFDPLALGGSVVALIAVAALASWVPARRAVRVDPIRSLREA